MESIDDSFENIKEKLKLYPLMAIKIAAVSASPKHIWSSKFFGKPYWPKNKNYPCSKKGVPLCFLAQINFDETPVLKGYPKEGILQFYIANDDSYGFDDDLSIGDLKNNSGGYRVVYHDEVVRDHSKLEQDFLSSKNDFYFSDKKEYSLIFSLDQEIASPMEYRFEKQAGNVFDLEQELGEYIFDNLSSKGSKIGGYASFIEYDPRESLKKSQNWVLLFQMDTQDVEGDNVMLEYCETINFFVQADRLENNDFSTVLYNWERSLDSYD